MDLGEGLTVPLPTTRPVRFTGVRVTLRAILRVILTAIVTVALSGCGEAVLNYSPPVFSAVEFSIGSDGQVSVHAGPSIVTPIGSFSVEDGVSHDFTPPDNSTLVVIRHWQHGHLHDSAYSLRATKALVVVLDGRTTITASNRQFFVDASAGTVRRILVRDPAAPGSPDTPPAVAGAPAAGAPATDASVKPATVVRRYVAAINARDYGIAWDLGGRNLGDPYDRFVAGFAVTDHDRLTVLRERGARVAVRLVADECGGRRQQTFEGDYVVRNGSIVDASLRRVRLVGRC